MTPPAPTPPPAEWTIDVCATCGALAVYPFNCGHRGENWTIPVVVRARYIGEYRAVMAKRARRRAEGIPA